MRAKVDLSKLADFMDRLGTTATSPGVVYLTGGATSLMMGIRDQTIDIDIKLEPEPGGVFEAIARLKDDLDVNVELAAPDQFIPSLPGWKDRSAFIKTVGMVTFRHYDLYSQALSKIERGHDLDSADVKAYLDQGLINIEQLSEHFDAIRSELIRFPAIDADDFARKVNEFTGNHRHV